MEKGNMILGDKTRMSEHMNRSTKAIETRATSNEAKFMSEDDDDDDDNDDDAPSNGVDDADADDENHGVNK